MKSYIYSDFSDFLDHLKEKKQSEALHVHKLSKLAKGQELPYSYKSNRSAITLLLKGKLKISINLQTYIVEANSVTVLFPKSVFQILEIYEDIEFCGVVFSEEFTLENFLHQNDFDAMRFFASKESPNLLLSEERGNIVGQLMNVMYNINNAGEQLFYRRERLFHYFNVLTYELLEVYRTITDKVELSTSRKKDLIVQFLNILEINVRKERSVQFYADELCITPGYLSRILKETSGLTASEIIEETVIREARELLINTSYSIAKIAEELQFSNQSFFGKFFKKKMKISPQFFRKQNI